jgi:hypothetical protein
MDVAKAMWSARIKARRLKNAHKSDHTAAAPPTPSLLMKVGRVIDMFYTCNTSAMTGSDDDEMFCTSETVTFHNAFECAQGAANCDGGRMEDTGLFCKIPDMNSVTEDMLESRNEFSARSRTLTAWTNDVPSIVLQRENDTVCDELTLDGELLAMDRREELERLRFCGVSALDSTESKRQSDFDYPTLTLTLGSRRGIRRLLSPGRKDRRSGTKRPVTEKREGSLRRLRTALMPPRFIAATSKPTQKAE